MAARITLLAISIFVFACDGKKETSSTEGQAEGNEQTAAQAPEREVVAKRDVTALAGRIQERKTVTACDAIVQGDDTVPKTAEIQQSPVVGGVPSICTDLKDLGFVAAKADEVDTETPTECDANMGKASLPCFKHCLDLTAAFADPDQTVDQWRDDADSCYDDCEIGCDGKTDTERS